MSNYIPLSVPHLSGNEWKYVKDCLDTNWVSSTGKYVNLFEKKIEKYTKAKYAIACINGTSALHISLILSGISRNDEVIVPTVSFIAPINAINYCSAKPIFMDIDDNYTLDIKKTIEFLNLKTIFKNGITINKKTKRKISAIIVVHVYGRSVMLDKLSKVCKKKNISIIEDSAEGLGNFFKNGLNKNKHVGTVGKFGCLSFNGNKLITSGGGGMIMTNNKSLAKKAKYLTTTAKDDAIEFVHNEVGYNYRLTNIQAALGLAQLEKINQYLKSKKLIYLQYKKLISENKKLNFKEIPNYASSNYWLNLVEFKNISKKSTLLKKINLLKKNQIEVRPIWQLNHLQKKYKNCEKYKISNALSLINKTLCLPSSISLTKEDIKRVVSTINE
tara:strand:+ start:323 stop:1483 length:1161 start_codon:yes stop_codon:yes gene_type:complete